VLDTILPILSAGGKTVDVFPTHHSGAAVEIARSQNLDQVAAVGVIGGDGTLHEVLNGLLTRDDGVRPPLGIIPCGTGNTVAAHLGIVDPLTATHALLNGTTQPLDVLRVKTENQVIYCGNIVGWGAVTDINRTAEKLRWLGSARYNIAALLQIAFPNPRRIQLKLDGQSLDGDYLFAVACNTRSTGKGMLMAPRADVADGRVDLILVRATSRWQLLKLFRQIFDGSHVNQPCVEYHQVAELELATAGSEGLNLDGELRGTTPFQLSVVPRAVSVFVPGEVVVESDVVPAGG
jgi:diacylglycerol kinase (ATP)